MRSILTALILVLTTLVVNAQGETGSEGLFGSHLKIYVVVAVLAIILGCIFVFLFSMERRLKNLEEHKK